MDVLDNSFTDIIRYGVFASIGSRNIEINENDFTNNANGVMLVHHASAIPASVEINDNIFNGVYDPNGIPVPSTALSILNFPFPAVAFPLEILRNEITDCNLGIMIYNHSISSVFNVNSNVIKYLFDDQHIGTHTYRAIQLSSCNGPSVNENDIDWVNGPSDPSSFAAQLQGFRAEWSTRMRVHKNTMRRNGTGMYLQNNCDFSYLTCNVWYDCYPGIYHDNVTLPTQGSGCSATYNAFNGAIYSSSPYLKNDGFTQSGNPVVWYHIGSQVNSNLHYPLPDNNVINPIQVTSCLPQNPCGEGDPDFTGEPGYEDGKMQAVAEDSVEYVYYPDENEHGENERTYHAMADDPTLINTYEKEQFVEEYESSVAGAFRQVMEWVIAGNIGEAIEVNDGIECANAFDYNKKDFFSVYLSTFAVNNFNLSNGQYNIIDNIASQRAIDGGEAVYWSRAMLNKLTITDDNLSNLRLIKPGQENLDEENHELTINELPSGFSISTLKKEKIKSLHIFNTQQQLIYSTQPNSFFHHFNKGQFASGFYVAVAVLADGSRIKASWL